MKVDKHLVIYPSGAMKWVELHRVRRYDDIYFGDYAYDHDQIHQIIGCDLFEQVSLQLPGIVILVDECGKIKHPPQQHNELASRLYGGYAHGDDIVGPAVFFRMIGSNICPLEPVDEARLSFLLGVKLPEK